MKQALYFIAILLLPAMKANASHLMGGEIRYEYNGSGYTVTLKLYRDCAGVTLPGSALIKISSSSANTTLTQTLPQTQYHIVTPPCSGANKCYNPSSNLPGYAIGIYSANISIPSPAPDWVISFDIGSRTSLINLNGSSASNMHLEATLNNSAGNNSTPLIAADPPFYIPTSSITTPLQALDPDGDSIVIDKAAPMASANNNVLYTTGFSANAPLGSGGAYTINSNQTMTLKGSTLGLFALAFRVKEYRNGNLIGSYIREFACAVLPGGSLSYPIMNTQSQQVAFACPGKSGSASLSFTDPVTTDSVYIDANTPNLSGWTITPTYSPGKPTGSVSVSWTAPTNLNPQTLPYFFIRLHVRDNACPRAVSEYALLIRNQQCPADSVWPGDANNDKVVNLLDPLAIAVAYNKTGPARPNATTNWTPQWAQDWAYTYPLSGKNIKHGDCNGDGTINISDFGAIVSNWGLTHPKPGPRSKTSGVPDLYFDLSGISLAPEANISIPIKLGDAANSINDFYGLGTTVSIGGLTLSAQAKINTANSWLGNSSNTLEFNNNAGAATIHWAFARTDHQNTTGNGTIATLDFTVPASAQPGQTVTLSFAHTVMIDKDGEQITSFNALDTNAKVVPQDINNITTGIQNIEVIPNPSVSTASLYLFTTRQMSLNIQVTDITGKVLWHNKTAATSGHQRIALPANELTSGIYLVNVEGKNSRKVTKWIKQ